MNNPQDSFSILPPLPATKQFGIDGPGMKDLVSKNIYRSGPYIVVRELMQNAVDAITKAIRNAPSDYSPLIEIEVQTTASYLNLTVSDNGIGLREEEVAKCIGTVAFSDKRDSTDLIGRHGIGFYSYYMITDEVLLLSKAQGGDPAIQWKGSLDGGWVVTPTIATFESGTQVILKVNPEKVPDFTPEKILKLAKLYGSQLPCRIIFRHGRHEEVINEVPFWERADTEHSMLEMANDLIQEKKPLGAFTFNCPELGARGIAYVRGTETQLGVSTSHKLYVKRMLVGQHIRDLAPASMPFLKCAINADKISVNASREDIMMDTKALMPLHATIKDAFKRWMGNLLARDDSRLYNLTLLHETSLLDAAEANGDFFDLMVKYYPLESSLGRTTLQQSLDNHGRVVYVDTEEAYNRIEMKALREGRCVIRALYRGARRLMHLAEAKMPDSKLRKVTPAQFMAEYRQHETDLDPAKKRLQALTAEELSGECCSADFEEADDPFVAATLDLSSRDSIARMLGFDTADERHGGSKRLVFNLAHPLVDNLLDAYDVPADLGRAWVRLIYHEALLAAREVPNSSETRRHTRAQQTLWQATHG